MKKASLGCDGRQAPGLEGHSGRGKTWQEMPERSRGDRQAHHTHTQLPSSRLAGGRRRRKGRAPTSSSEFGGALGVTGQVVPVQSFHRHRKQCGV